MQKKKSNRGVECMAHELFKLCNSRIVRSNSYVTIYGTYDMHAFEIQSLSWWPAFEALYGWYHGRKQKVRKTRIIKRYSSYKADYSREKAKLFQCRKRQSSTRRRLDSNIFFFFLHSFRIVLSLDPSGTIQVRLLYLWVHMLNHNSVENSKKSRKTLATSIINKRGLSPKSGVMAIGRQMGVYFLVLLFIQASVQAGKVEFKHHNNTEMAEVLQQIHNRLVFMIYHVNSMHINRD